MRYYIHMHLTPLIQKAINESARLHGSINQTRKLGGLPYIVHPYSVGWLLADAGSDEEVVVAGILHDVLEDVLGPSGLDYLKKEFGERVAQAVFDVSEKKDPKVPTDTKASWLERKEGYLAHLKQASTDALLVSLADKIQNLESMTDSFKTDGPTVFAKFNNSEGKFLWFYEQVLLIGQQKLPDHPLTKHLAEAVAKGRSAFGIR